jgi:hypothetical protein
VKGERLYDWPDPHAQWRPSRRALLYDKFVQPWIERWGATKMLVRPDDPQAMYVGRFLRVKALLLIWLAPLRWDYPYDCKHCEQVCGYDESRLGGEYNSWEATFVAIPHRWWRLARAHIYREGGP